MLRSDRRWHDDNWADLGQAAVGNHSSAKKYDMIFASLSRIPKYQLTVRMLSVESFDFK